ncbi:3-hydroxyphenylacetate 6-hydroxylase [Hypsizygus marmoreus]|uniref:3-hydroxyphenylacetate 6-hydroxylase n=1 Tax=Hypsizygus marmoreus TaxID=39966 RepID=A0A369K9Y1_HYPMA|nr:3-hydroxyphenylacetate 6-hydroxylase [Hypsizygus marmoreus]
MSFQQLPWASQYAAAGVVFFCIVVPLVAWVSKPEKVPDLPGPKGWPIVGSLFSRGSDPAETYRQWCKIYGPVFRVRLGNKYVVVINTADAGDELLASAAYASTFQSRPVSHTFGELLKHATRKTITIGSSPYDDQLKGKRRLAIASVSPAAIKSYQDIMDESTQSFVRDLNDARKLGCPINPWPIFFRNSQALAISTYLGAPIKETAHVFDDIPYPMKRLAQIRNIHGRLRDYLPFLRLLPEANMFSEAVAVAKYRNARLKRLLDRCLEQFADGTARPCGAVTMMSSQKTELTDEDLTSVSNSMVSSGCESHLPNTLLWSLGMLATNRDMQEKCYQAVLRRETMGDNVDLEKDHDDYLMAFVKEGGRYFATFRLSLARETIGKDCIWQGHYIPEGTMVWANTYAMNRDDSRFALPEKFMPERYMSGPEAERSMPHYGFGVGRRMCPATVLVHKETYAIFKTILTHFSIDLYDGESKFDAIKSCSNGWDFNHGPKPFRITLNVRDQRKLDSFLETEF